MIMQDTSSLKPVRSGQHTDLMTLPHTGFVRQSLLLRFVPFSKSTLWRRVKAGLFPAPVRISVGITAWRAEDVRHWIAEQK
ncbi:MAG: AlpA family phage regulatory protein [Thauera sp.]|jgi:predicted DNA-binding transcriptional regulator AlpA|nr:AlpA family phage regulatory protein [Thauera sp.]